MQGRSLDNVAQPPPFFFSFFIQAILITSHPQGRDECSSKVRKRQERGARGHKGSILAVLPVAVV